MKTQIIIFFFSILCTAFLFSECKKYEEDHVFLHFKSVRKRIDSGEFWYFDKLIMDDIDITEIFRNDSAYFEKIDLHIFNHGNTPPPANFYVYRFGTNAAIGQFELSENKENITLAAGNCCEYSSLSDSTTTFGPIFIRTEWKIIKLTKSNFWLETNHDSKKYLLKLKK